MGKNSGLYYKCVWFESYKATLVSNTENCCDFLHSLPAYFRMAHQADDGRFLPNSLPVE